MLLYRALNEEDMKNLSLEEDILCQAREHDLNHASIIDIIFRKNNISGQALSGIKFARIE